MLYYGYRVRAVRLSYTSNRLATIETMSHSPPSSLVQRYLGDRREFHLEEERIRCKSKDSSGELEFFVNYSDLTTQTRRFMRRDGRIYTFAVSFGLFALVGFVADLLGYSLLMRWAPFWAVVAIIFLGFYFWRRRSFLFLDLSNGKTLVFLENNPSAEALSQFLQEMNEARKRYFRRKYFKIIDPSNPRQEMARFEWLLDNEIISKQEMEDMVTELMGHEFFGAIGNAMVAGVDEERDRPSERETDEQ